MSAWSSLDLLGALLAIDTNSNAVLSCDRNHKPEYTLLAGEVYDDDYSDDEVDIEIRNSAADLPPLALTSIFSTPPLIAVDIKGKGKQQESPVSPTAEPSRSPKPSSPPRPPAAQTPVEIVIPQPIYAQSSPIWTLNASAAGLSYSDHDTRHSPRAGTSAPLQQSATWSPLSSQIPLPTSSSYTPYTALGSIHANHDGVQTSLELQRAEASSEERARMRPRPSRTSKQGGSTSGRTNSENEPPASSSHATQSSEGPIAQSYEPQYLEAELDERSRLHREEPPTPEAAPFQSYTAYFRSTDDSSYLNTRNRPGYSDIGGTSLPPDFLDCYESQPILPVASRSNANASTTQSPQHQPEVAVPVQHSPRPFTQALGIVADMSTVGGAVPTSSILFDTASEQSQSSWATTLSTSWTAYHSPVLPTIKATIPQNDSDAKMDSFVEMMIDPAVPIPNASMPMNLEDVEMADVFEPQSWTMTTAPNDRDSDVQDSPMTDLPPLIPDYHLETVADVEMEDAPAITVPKKSIFSDMLSASLRNRLSVPMETLPAAPMPQTVPINTPPAPSSAFAGLPSESVPFPSITAPLFAPPAVSKLPPMKAPSPSRLPSMNSNVATQQQLAYTLQPARPQPFASSTPLQPSSPVSPILGALLATSQDSGYYPVVAFDSMRSGCKTAYAARLPPRPWWADSIYYARPREMVNPPPAPQRTVTFPELVHVCRRLVNPSAAQFKTYEEITNTRKENFRRLTALAKPFKPFKAASSASWFSFSTILKFLGF